jgi:flagellin-like hook-associated protein FlgL
MTLTLNSTALALSIANRLGQTQGALDTVSERLSSNLRLSRQDAADISIAEQLRVDARVFTQGVRNVNEGISLANTTEVSLRELEAITVRQLELAQQASNGSTSAVQRRALDAEANALVDEFNRIVESTQYNGIKTLKQETAGVHISAAARSEEDLILIETNEQLQRTVGDGTFIDDGSYIAGSVGVTDFVSGDFNGDGRDDIVSLNTGADEYGIMFGQADGSLSAVTTNGLYDPGAKSITKGDFDADGDLDFAVAVIDDELAVYLNDGNGNFSDSGQDIESSLDNIQASDINGDGALDIVSTVIADFVTQDSFDSGQAEVSTLSIGTDAGGGGVAEVTELTFSEGTVGSATAERSQVQFYDGSTFDDGDYFTLFTANDATEYKFFYEIDGGPAPFPPPGGISVKISINSSDTADEVRDATTAVVDAQTGISLTNVGSGVAVFENDATGIATDVSITQTGTGLLTNVIAQGSAGGGSGFDDGDYFLISSDTTDYYVWFDVSGSAVDPSIGLRTGIEVTLSDPDTSGGIASKVQAALDAIGGFSASVLGDTVTVTNTVTGNVTDAADGVTSGAFSAVVTTQGASGGGGGADISTGEYFTFGSPTTSYYAWFDIDDTGSDPAPGGTGIEIDITASDTAIQAATKAAAAIDALGDFSASSTNEVVTITNAATGSVVNINTGTLSGASASVLANGADPDIDIVSDTITLNNHEFSTGDTVQLTTTGTLPAPLLTATNYFVIEIDANTIQLASSFINAGSGTQIDLTTIGSGDHTITNTVTGAGVAVSFGNNDGTFDAPVLSQISAAGELKIGDFNGDGSKDVAVAKASEVEILHGSGSGSFNKEQTLITGGTSSSLEVADLDRDGYSDIVVANNDTNTVETYRGSSSTIATSGNSYAVAATATDVATGDFNGDGIIDLAVASDSGGGAAVSILTGDGGGDFTVQSSESIANQVAITALDVNGDGVTDLGVLNGTQEVDVLLANTEQDTNIGYVDLTTQTAAIDSLDTLEQNRIRLVQELGEVGASISRLGTTVSALEIQRDEAIGAENRIRSIDVAKEVAEFTALSVRRDAATALLGQVAVMPTLALELLQGSLV